MYEWIVFAGTMAFALSGVLAGRVARPDIVGGFILAIVTAIGGGAIRDICLGNPVSTLRDPALVGGILVTALVGMVAYAPLQRYGQRILVIADAIGLGVFNAAGFLLAVTAGLPVVSAMILGAISGCGGGMIRDVLCRRTPFVMLPGEMYFSACMLGTALALPLRWWSLSETAMLVTIAAWTTGLRLVSLWRGWKLPTYPLGGRA